MISNNTNIFKWVFDVFKIKGEPAPVFVEDYIQPTVSVSPITNVLRHNSAINSTTATIYSTPSDRDFFLTGASLSLIKDAGATSTGSSVKVVIDGNTRNLLTIISLTTTAQNDAISQSFNKIKIDRGTDIVVTNGSANANVSAIGIIEGFIVE